MRRSWVRLPSSPPRTSPGDCAGYAGAYPIAPHSGLGATGQLAGAAWTRGGCDPRRGRGLPRCARYPWSSLHPGARGAPTACAPHPGAARPLNARTTSDFLEKYNLQIAINGDGFDPWWVFGPFYYPHVGDPVSPRGFAMSDKVVYAETKARGDYAETGSAVQTARRRLCLGPAVRSRAGGKSIVDE